MSALELALDHISYGTSYSWDLTTLISSGVPVSEQLRQKVLAGSATKTDADYIRGLLRERKRVRRPRPGKGCERNETPQISLRD